MDLARWETIETLSWRLMTASEEEREATLRHTRKADPDLADQVESLITEWLADPDFLEGATVARASPPPELETSRTVGPFTLIRPLGQGGMGEVHLALEESDGMRRHVALKLIRAGLDHAGILARFHQERQILASLDHPAVARLYAVGSAEGGRPWLSMEFVEGRPLTEFVEQRGLGLPDRLELFRRICSGVQHAHHRLVVHLDLKPSNILVTEGGHPKLLDFGVAAALSDRGEACGDDPMSRAATPAYASPEQLRGQPSGVPSDVFSLGVILHELISGRHPFPDRSSAEVPAIPPPSHPRDRLTEDFAAVVARAIAPDPEARYPTVSALVDDVERALTHRPVRARPMTRRYVASRFVRRHRLAVATATVVVLLLIGFSAVTALQSRRIAAESERVARERDEALAVRSFLLESFGTQGADGGGDAFTARQLLDGRAAVLEDQYGDDPSLHAEMMGVLAEGYEKLGLLSEAEPLARAAVELRRERIGPNDPDLPAALVALGWIVHQAGRLEEAEPILREALAAARAAFPGDHPITARALNDLGVNLEARAAWDAAEAAYTEALDMRRRLLGDADAVVGVTASNLSVVRYRRGDLVGAAAMAREAHDLFVRVLGPDHQRTMIVENNLAAMQAAAGDTEGARATYRDILERRRRIFGDRHPNTAQSMAALATMIPPGEGDAEAEALLREALDVQREALGPDHPSVANSARRLATVLVRTDRPAAASPLFREALRIQRSTLGPTHPTTAETLNLLGGALQEAGELAQAETTYSEALGILASELGESHTSTARTRVWRSDVRTARGNLGGASSDIRSALPTLQANLEPGHPIRQEARLALVRLHTAMDDLVAADSVLTEVESYLTEEQRTLAIGLTAARYREQLGAR